jgi:hypothetical protein
MSRSPSIDSARSSIAARVETNRLAIARCCAGRWSSACPPSPSTACGGYGAGLVRCLELAGVPVSECERSRRQERRRGKSDLIDAALAAQRLLSGDGLCLPRGGGRVGPRTPRSYRGISPRVAPASGHLMRAPLALPRLASPSLDALLNDVKQGLSERPVKGRLVATAATSYARRAAVTKLQPWAPGRRAPGPGARRACVGEVGPFQLRHLGVKRLASLSRGDASRLGDDLKSPQLVQPPQLAIGGRVPVARIFGPARHLDLRYRPCHA